MSEKLQKILANFGLGSRRQMELVIAAGRVSINGQIAKLGDRARPSDLIRVDGHVLNKKTKNSSQKIRLLLYHKPAGEICTRHDPEGRKTVFEHLPSLHQARWIAIGRLDYHTSGLLLFTNHGELANQLMHPSAELEREYAVRILGKVTKDILQQLSEGVMLEDGMAKFEKIELSGGEGANVWYHVVVKQGKNRIVRRLWESQGVKVSRLIRVRFGDIVLPRGLKAGKFIDLEQIHIDALKNACA